METKPCSRCQVEKPLSDFYANRNTRSGRASGCKTCVNAQHVEYSRSYNRHRKNGTLADFKKSPTESPYQGKFQDDPRIVGLTGPELYAMLRKLNGEARRSYNRELARSLKNGPCADCGQTFPPHVMDWDHVRGVKRFELGKAATQMYSERTIRAEIEKCELVCSNCHRIRTYDRRTRGGDD